MTGVAGIEVIGGSGGLDARYDDIARIGSRIGVGAGELLRTAAGSHLLLLDPDLLASAALAPTGFARVEAAILAALDGPDGLAVAAGRLEVREIELGLAVVRYRLADRLGKQVTEWRRCLQGHAALLVVPLTLTMTLPLLADPQSAWLREIAADAADEEFLAEHPWIVEETIGSAPGFLGSLSAVALGPALLPADAVFRARTGATLLPSGVEEAAGLLALLYPRGRAVAVHLGSDPRAALTMPPTDVATLLSPLALRDREAVGPRQGEIQVRVIRGEGSGGRRRTSYVVDIPGTKDWQLDPRERRHLTDFATSLTAMSGGATARVDGVASALRAAGARPGDPVLLVGHSQGGMVAMRAAQAWTRSGDYTVTHVLTAGAPVAGMDVPESVQALSLESRQDVVPHLDAAPNRDRSHHTTVAFDAAEEGLVANHDLTRTYLPGARALSSPPYDADPSLRAWIDGAGAFLAAPGERVVVRAEVFDIRNVDDLR